MWKEDMREIFMKVWGKCEEKHDENIKRNMVENVNQNMRKT